MYPEILNLGPLHLRSYGLMMAIAFLVATWMLMRQAERKGIDPDHIVSLGMVCLVSGVFGGRLMYVLAHPQEFRGQWQKAFFLWEGGLTLWGGFLIAVPLALLYLHRKRLPVWTIADMGAIPLAIGASLGRIGCFLNGCCYGLPTSLPWGIHFPQSSLPYAQFDGQALHPSQLYNVGAGLLASGITLLVSPLLRAPGQRFWFLFGLYGVLRALVDLTRYYEPTAILWTVRGVHVTESQVIGVAIAVISAAFFFYLGRKHRLHEAARAADVAPATDPQPAAS